MSDRDLGDVLDAMLAHIPIDHPLRERFKWLAGDIRYKAPEQMREGWFEASSMLSVELGPPETLTEDWQTQVIAIFTDKRIEEVNGARR